MLINYVLIRRKRVVENVLSLYHQTPPPTTPTQKLNAALTNPSIPCKISILAQQVPRDAVVWNEEIFATTCESVAKSWCTFDHLHKQYSSMSVKKRESQLTKWLAGVEEIENSLNLQFISITSIATEPTVGISNLVRNLNLKNEVVLPSVSSLLELQLKVSNKDLLNSLRRHIMQLKGTISYSRNFPKSSVSLSCFNSNSLTCYCALETLIEIENGNSANWEHTS